VGVERGAVVGVGGGEGGHADRFRIPHLLEQGIEAGILDRAQRHLRHSEPPDSAPAAEHIS
jgi:hypothetical protein